MIDMRRRLMRSTNDYDAVSRGRLAGPLSGNYNEHCSRGCSPAVPSTTLDPSSDSAGASSLPVSPRVAGLFTSMRVSGVSHQRKTPHFERRSSKEAPTFDSNIAFGERYKGMQSSGSLLQRLTRIGQFSYRQIVQGPTALSQTVSKPSIKAGSVVRSSSSRDREEYKEIGESDMGDLVRPLKQILPALQEVIPSLSGSRHKGQAGKIGVIGGCREYTGAPFYAAFSALRIGADLSHVFCTEGAGTVIKSYSPELIVHPVLRESHDAKDEYADKNEVIKKVVADVGKWIRRFDCLVIGPGLGRDDLLMECVAQVMTIARENNTPMVIDGDGLSLVTSNPNLVIGYPLAILTPNVNEHKRLAAKMADTDTSKISTADLQLKALAERMSGVTIVQKGKQDLISDGRTVLGSAYFGSPRRCGGQGDVLSGSTAVFMAWCRQFFQNAQGEKARKLVEDSISGNPGVVSALAGSMILRKAAGVAFAKHKRSMLTTDIIEALGPSIEELFPVSTT